MLSVSRLVQLFLGALNTVVVCLLWLPFAKETEAKAIENSYVFRSLSEFDVANGPVLSSPMIGDQVWVLGTNAPERIVVQGVPPTLCCLVFVSALHGCF